jgi:transposase
MNNKFINLNDLQPIKIDKSFKGWLKEDSLARFIVEIVNQLDISNIDAQYNTSGSPGYPPRMMIALIFYSYASGIFSSRKIEKATYELIPAIFITQGLHPDHSAIAHFRKRFLKNLEDIFVQILLIASEMGVLKLGSVSLDGTKIKANASKHKALSYEYACKLEDKLQQEISFLMAKANESEHSENNDINIPEELQRREDRLKNIITAKETMEKRRKMRYEQEKKDYDTKLKERALKEKANGRKLGGKKPVAPDEKPKPSDQVNLTDEESRIMPESGGGFQQAYNAQAAVDMDTMLILENHVSQSSNDKQELQPILNKIAQLPKQLGAVDKAAADNGYKSESNTVFAAEAGIELYVPVGRQKHNNKLDELLSQDPVEPINPTPSEAISHRMLTKVGKAFYALRKTTIEPTFGIIKEVMGFRRFSLRGLDLVKGEWTLVSIAYNLKKLCALNLKIT